MADPRRIAVAALAAAAWAAAAAPAAAQRPNPDDVVSVYDVRFDGDVSYQHRRVYDAEHFADESTSFRVIVKGRGLTFRDRAVTHRINTPDIQLGFPRTSTHEVTDDGPIDCRGSGSATTAGFAHVGPSDPFSFGEGLVIFLPFGGVSIAMACTGPDGPYRETLDLSVGWQPETPGNPGRPPAFGYVFSPFATREPDPVSLRLPIDRAAPAKGCPRRDVYTRSCTARLRGTLVFTRTGGTPLPDRASGGAGRADARRAAPRRSGRAQRRAPPRSRRRGRTR